MHRFTVARIEHRALYASRSLALCILTLAPLPRHARGAEPPTETQLLRQEVEQLRDELAARDRRLEELERRLRALESATSAPPPAQSAAPAAAPQTALDSALAGLGLAPDSGGAAAAPVPAAAPAPGFGALRLIDLSLDALVAAGTSTEQGESLELLQGGGHDPRARGFTLQGVEFSLMGAVDPYLTAESHAVASVDPGSGESEFELEEAFATTQGLPAGLQVEAGHFLTEFGRINPRHPHSWDWQDQPIINTRLFGGDGMRGTGMRLGWLAPLPWYSQLHLGAQNATGSTMTSFLGGQVAHAHGESDASGESHGSDASDHAEHETGIGGRPIVEQEADSLADLAYLARWENAFALAPTATGQAGLSALVGPNSTGENAQTLVYGSDLVLKWRPANHFRGWPFFRIDAEAMWRDYEAAAVHGDPGADPDLELAGETLEDWGFYAQWLWGFRHPWAAGARYEYASGSGESVGGRDADPFRDDRGRIAPLLVWHPTEYSRLRLQYNYDEADHLAGGDAHSVWLGLEFLYGSHPAHEY